MQEQQKNINLDRIDQALMQSTQELERLASVYKTHGFEFESEEILGTIKRIRSRINSESVQPGTHELDWTDL
jgi:hypothetical protein